MDSGFHDHNDSALLLNRTSANIIRCEFISNTGCYTSDQHEWNGDTDMYSAGGAVLAFNSTVTINESYFEGNNAQLGGAIFGNEYCVITITNSTFCGSIYTSNLLQCGESVYAGEGVTVNIESSFFTNNNQKEAIYLCSGENPSTVNIVSSHFFNNSAGVILSETNIDFFHCRDLRQPKRSTTVSVNIETSMFTKNQGIVVHLNSVNYPSTANIVSSQFDSNSGNSVLLANSKIDIEWLPVKSKTKSDFINIESSIFTNNQGIVVYLSNQNNPSTTSIVFSQFYSNSGGPVIFAKSSMDYELELSKTSVKLASSNFTDNIGGAIRASDCSIDTSCDDSTSVKIIDSIFLNNSESGAHGAVYAVDIDISESNFHNNSEGAIRSLFGLNLTRSNFTYNINNNYTNRHIPPLPSAGGVVYAGGNVSISRCCFLYNEALFGGAIYWSNDNDLPMHISSCHFEGNKAHNKVELYILLVKDTVEEKLKQAILSIIRQTLVVELYRWTPQELS